MLSSLCAHLKALHALRPRFERVDKRIDMLEREIRRIDTLGHGSNVLANDIPKQKDFECPARRAFARVDLGGDSREGVLLVTWVDREQKQLGIQIPEGWVASVRNNVG